MRQCRAHTPATIARDVASHDKDLVPALATLEAQASGIRRVCSGTLRDCVEHLDDVQVDGAAVFKSYAKRLGTRDSGLAFVRMQLELRVAQPTDCSDPIRRRAILQAWADRAVVGTSATPPSPRRCGSETRTIRRDSFRERCTVFPRRPESHFAGLPLTFYACVECGLFVS